MASSPKSRSSSQQPLPDPISATGTFAPSDPEIQPDARKPSPVAVTDVRTVAGEDVKQRRNVCEEHPTHQDAPSHLAAGQADLSFKARIGRLDPFVARVRGLLDDAIAREWNIREKLAARARVSSWDAALRAEYDAAAVCVENLARQLDNISVSKLRRELRKLGAQPPGELIRHARIAYACRLLIESRLLVREIAARAGYDSEKHFAEQFQRIKGMTPSAYRRAHVERSFVADPPAVQDEP